MITEMPALAQQTDESLSQEFFITNYSLSINYNAVLTVVKNVLVKKTHLYGKQIIKSRTKQYVPLIPVGPLVY